MYTHKVQYYETDKMGITHHSNYIRWMERGAELTFWKDPAFPMARAGKGRNNFTGNIGRMLLQKNYYLF